MRETNKYYFFWKHQFGQWTLRNMTDKEGLTYNCCEQYMMYKKALLFNNKEIAKDILSEKNPKKQKDLGRLVKNFDISIWDKHKFNIVWHANFFKFSQHLDLKNRLLLTGNKTLVEASPEDLIWGVGLEANDDRILESKNWTGQNLLGKVLMSVRSSLKSSS